MVGDFCYLGGYSATTYFDEIPYWRYKDFPEYKQTEKVSIPAEYDTYSGLYRATEKTFNYWDVLDFSTPVARKLIGQVLRIFKLYINDSNDMFVNL